ncbi:MAG: alcohol dehydrogenase catalytic domain-containing protein [Phycisphaerae bacterium]|nr:alcohol dehydrogenase catalytic domain-containing protein [Phycisphaerae bacterium]
MKVAVIPAIKKPFMFEERPIPEAGPGQIRIKVAACGVCHSDYHIWEGLFNFARLPIVPGHEVAGHVDQVGPGVDWWKVGDRAGMPWIFSTCGHCDACVAGDDPGCPNQLATGVTVDGGYAPYMLAPAAYATRIPEGIDLAEAAPLFCAGLTVYTPLAEAGVRSGMTVAVQGLGGLGHLGVQYARALGARVVGITRGEEKCAFARSLGAEEAIDTQREDPGKALRRLGGADLILTTVTTAAAIAPLLAGLKSRGTLAFVGAAPETIPIVPMYVVSRRLRIIGSIVGNRRQMREVLDVAVRHNVRPRIERYRLEQVQEVFQRMAENKIRYRAVLTF